MPHSAFGEIVTNAVTLYPLLDGGTTTVGSPAGPAYNFTETSGAARPGAGDRVRVRSIVLAANGNNDTVELRTHSGAFLAEIIFPNKGSRVWDFGPDGIVTDDGFRLVVPAGVRTKFLFIDWELL